MRQQMKRPTTASLKRVNAENVAGLGAERLAEILIAVANRRPELKRQLRMELAATQGVDHLATEVDKRLTSLETVVAKVSWRQRPTFLRDLEALRVLISERMAGLDQSDGLDRMWRFMASARYVAPRVRDKHGELDALFLRGAEDLGALVRSIGDARTGDALMAAMEHNPQGWRTWAPIVLLDAPAGLAASTLRSMVGMHLPGQLFLVRLLADAAGDVDAYAGTFPDDAIRDPANAAAVANRLLAAGRIDEAGSILEAAGAKAERLARGKGPAGVNVDWETSTIDYLERSGQTEAAQAARWAAFEATLSVERAKAFTARLADFDDVEAESRAFALAATHADFQRGLAFLMAWPAIAEAGRMIEARPDDIRVPIDQVDLWAPQLRRIKPRAAHLLLRKAAADAFRRREFATCDRLTLEAEAIDLPKI